MKRVEGLSKLTGREPFLDDLPMANALWGGTVRSPSPRGRIMEVRFGSGVDWSEFVVVDPNDIPGKNAVHLIESDQPVLASDYVRHLHEPVVLLAHPSRDELRRGIRAGRGGRRSGASGPGLPADCPAPTRSSTEPTTS